MRFSTGFQDTLAKVVLLSGVLIFLGPAVQVTMAQNHSGKKMQEPLIHEAEKLLADLGYWIIKIDDKKDSSTYHAITAFQKVEGRRRTGILTQKELNAMRLASRPVGKYTGPAHIEIDVTRQIIFLVDESGIVTQVLPVSTGNDKKYFDKGIWQTAHTPRGDFKIMRQIAGVRRASLGDLYHPNYFFGGWAIHGSMSVPFLPASHGCVRIPNFAAKDFSRLVWVGMNVFVYD